MRVCEYRPKYLESQVVAFEIHEVLSARKVIHRFHQNPCAGGDDLYTTRRTSQKFEKLYQKLLKRDETQTSARYQAMPLDF